MASHPELRLISRVIETGDFRTVLKMKISQQMFRVPQARTMFNYIWKYYNNEAHPGKIPTQRKMKSRYTSFRHYNAKESVKELCEEVRQDAMANSILELVDGIEDRVSIDPYAALEHLRNGIMRAQTLTLKSRDVILADSAEELIREYDMMKKHEGITGIPFPWEELNQATQGMHPEDLIIIFARPKSLKTYTAVKVATHAYIEANRRVLFYSAEMRTELIRKRVAASLTDLDYKSVKTGKLSESDEIWYKDALTTLKEDERMAYSKTGHRRSFLIASSKGDIHGTGSVNHVHLKAQEFEPDLIVVDATYRLASDEGKRDYDWKAQGGIVRDLKHLAQTLQVPILITSQANRVSDKISSLEGMADIAYADIAGQEVDLGLRIVKKGKDADGLTNLLVRVAGAREFDDFDGFYLKVSPYTRFDFDRWFVADEEEDPPSTNKRARKTKKGSEWMTPQEEKSTESFLQKQR